MRENALLATLKTSLPLKNVVRYYCAYIFAITIYYKVKAKYAFFASFADNQVISIKKVTADYLWKFFVREMLNLRKNVLCL